MTHRATAFMRCLMFACLAASGCTADTSHAAVYHLEFRAKFTVDEPVATASITVSQARGLLRSMDLNAPEGRYTVVSADGKATADNGRIRWTPPANGGSLVYRVQLDSPRGTTFDARHTPDWLIMRLGDLFPPAIVRTLKSSTSTSSLALSGPAHWSFESRYGALGSESRKISGARRYNRPTGWLIAGQLGTRRENIAGRRIVISAPQDSGFRRLDALAFLAWTLPELTRVFPDLPGQILIVGAPRAMWRGGLSAPGSIYLHTDRPLVSENGTSTLLHELAHLAGLHSAADDADWLAEGFAEYYALLILKRSGGLSQKRFDRALRKLEYWVVRDDGRLTSPSKGVDTAAAVLELHRQAQQLEAAGRNIDQLVERLLHDEEITLQGYQKALADLLPTRSPERLTSDQSQ